VNNDLERIADLAVNMAERVRGLRAAEELQTPDTLSEMAQLARRMVSDALDSLVRLDPDAALEVCATDDAVDRSHAEIVHQLYHVMRNNADDIAAAIHFLSVARQVERIADHATNIAEDVVYLVRGDIARHRGKQLQEGKMGSAETVHEK
jgi:phosphate transport system protein